jgi:hypothetical protein
MDALFGEKRGAVEVGVGESAGVLSAGEVEVAELRAWGVPAAF